MDTRGRVTEAVSASLSFDSSLRIFFSPEGEGEFLPCWENSERNGSALASSPSSRHDRPSPIVVGKESGESSLVMEGNSVRVVIHLNKSFPSARVLTLLRFPPSPEGEWLRQDPPSGSPAEVAIVEHSTTTRAGKSSGARKLPDDPLPLFVVKESHYSHGLLWDPDDSTPAENCCHPGGGIHWRRRYSGGICRSSSGSPCLEVFWPSGLPKVVEYGREGVGKHRPSHEGPAYQEFLADGRPCFVMFAQSGKAESCSWFSPDGKPLQLLRSGQEAVDSSSLLSPGNLLSEFSVCPPALSALRVMPIKAGLSNKVRHPSRTPKEKER
jgi:hypothetical protein